MNEVEWSYIILVDDHSVDIGKSLSLKSVGHIAKSENRKKFLLETASLWVTQLWSEKMNLVIFCSSWENTYPNSNLWDFYIFIQIKGFRFFFFH